MPYPEVKSESYANIGGVNQKASQYVTGVNEVLQSFNLDLTKPGSLTKRPGSTFFSSLGPTLSIGSTSYFLPHFPITGLYEYSRLSGESYLIASGIGPTASPSTPASGVYTFQGGTIRLFAQSINPASYFDFTTFVDWLFFCNGSILEKFNGSTAYLFSLPTPPLPAGMFQNPQATTGIVFPPGSYGYGYGYLNNRGYAGPIFEYLTNITQNATFGGVLLQGFTNIENGVPGQDDFGVSAIIVYRTDNSLSTLYEIARVPPGTTQFFDPGLTLTTNQAPQYLFFTLVPRYIEIYNNQLFSCGFSSLLSTMYFSDIGEPEGVGATATFEVRTNDGDRLTGLKAYYSSLMIFKKYSFHQLLGTDPTNFQLNELSDQYGCLSNRAVCVYQDNLLFLDRKGICQFNGANISIISNRLEPLFQRMNIQAAIDQAIMLHVKSRNEVWCAFPVDGATLNNHMAIYDYVCDGWYEVEGPQPSSLGLMTGPFPQPLPFYGDYSGTIYNFGSSQTGYLPSDNGIGFSCVAQVPFRDGGFGYSVTKQFRRLFLDTDPIGISSILQINFRKDEGASIVYGTTMSTGRFQSRIDFGIPAKSLSAEIGFYNASLPFRLNGWTYHARFQRDR